jgi:hypothetical protein
LNNKGTFDLLSPFAQKRLGRGISFRQPFILFHVRLAMGDREMFCTDSAFVFPGCGVYERIKATLLSPNVTADFSDV